MAQQIKYWFNADPSPSIPLIAIPRIMLEEETPHYKKLKELQAQDAARAPGTPDDLNKLALLYHSWAEHHAYMSRQWGLLPTLEDHERLGEIVRRAAVADY